MFIIEINCEKDRCDFTETLRNIENLTDAVPTLTQVEMGKSYVKTHLY